MMLEGGMTNKLKVGIAGYGVVGKRRRIFIDQHPMLETVVVCDRIFSDEGIFDDGVRYYSCLLYTSPSPRDGLLSRMPSSA